MKTTAFLKWLAFVMIIAGISYSCKKNNDVTDNPIVTPPPTTGPYNITLPGSTVVLSVVGKVIDENNNPVSGATITGGGASTTTNANGVFRINNGSFNGSFATVKIEKSNYFTLVKTLISKSGNTQYIVGKISPRTLAGTIAATGGSLQFGSGSVTIDFPANAFVDASNNAVTGPVSVYATYIDPTSADAKDRMPGNLSAIEAPSTEYLLQSFGMMGVELKDANGQTVKLASGKTASLTANIPASLSASAPATIPLWYFDDANGVWVKDGVATKTGNTYKGDVSHFTFWNMDVYNSWVFFEARFLNVHDSSALPYAHFSINGVGSAAVYHEYTESDGTTFGMVPDSVPLQLRFYATDGTVLLDTTIGPYTTDVNIGDVYINFPPVTPTISGTLVDCTGQVVSHGSISVMIDSLDFPATVANDGTFSITLYDNIPTNTIIHVTGIDSTTNTVVPAYTITYTGGSAIHAGFVFACATGGPSEFISYNLDGTDHLFIRNTDSVFCWNTQAFNRTNLSCRRANGNPQTEGIVSFITGPTSVGGTDTSSILTLHQYTTASTPKSLNIVSFTESYSAYPPTQQAEGWVIGTFTCVFTDDVNITHNITANFRAYRAH
ncbi:MAG: carboxypeptidase-like regulatory domain-containing protein [Ferruginibacter sp.]